MTSISPGNTWFEIQAQTNGLSGEDPTLRVESIRLSMDMDRDAYCEATLVLTDCTEVQFQELDPRTMGHGDDIVIADANFPSSFLGPKVIRADGVDATMMAEAILTHMPLDTFVPEAAWRMEEVGNPTSTPEVCAQFQKIVHERAGNFKVATVERFAFYELSRKAADIVATTEFRLYGNLILRKGVVHPHEVFRG